MVRGRKPFVERSSVRDMRLTVRLSAAEYHYLQGLALKQGRSIGDVLRLLALTGMPSAKEEPLSLVMQVQGR
jgi:hypothetical protein